MILVVFSCYLLKLKDSLFYLSMFVLFSMQFKLFLSAIKEEAQGRNKENI